MAKNVLIPDYIFETSWEVCNKVGGIYTVLSTRAKTMQAYFKDKVIFIGPDIWQGKENSLFQEQCDLFESWKFELKENTKIKVRIGRWNILGNPIVFLVDFSSCFAEKDKIYTDIWLRYGVDSLHAYGDYDESCMFSFAAAKVVESFYHYYLTSDNKVIYHAHEWMAAMGMLYLKSAVPQIATIFTTHATSIGRSIACNQKPLYDYLSAYNGDQMAEELNMQSKHSVEKQAAHNADCFTTVSEVTDKECAVLLEKPADVILTNGFESEFVPKGAAFDVAEKEARKRMLQIANKLVGIDLDDNTLIVSTSGRYEFKNKGIDVFIEALSRLNKDKNLRRNVLAYINVPACMAGIRTDLRERLNSNENFNNSLSDPFITHWLHNMDTDQIVNMLKHVGLTNKPENKVKVVFVPCYLDGNDGVLNKSYYDIIIGSDINVFASYYEPWGYTPLESVAFHVPTITTDLAGFGVWIKSLGNINGIDDAVEVLQRTDSNYSAVADGIMSAILYYSNKSQNEVGCIKQKAALIAKKALWKNFIKNYFKAYDVALRNAEKRQ